MEKDLVMLAELEKRYDTFLQSKELQNYLTARDFQNKWNKVKQEGKKAKFFNDERELMLFFLSAKLGAKLDQADLIFMFFERLWSQDNLTSATSSEPVSLFGGDEISSLTTKLTSGNQSDEHNPILVLSEQLKTIESVKAK